MPATETSPPLVLQEGEEDHAVHESSPLLPRPLDDDDDAVGVRNGHPSSSLSRAPPKRSWSSAAAIIVLVTLVMAIIVLGFLVPPTVQRYVEQALVLEPTSLQVESLGADEVRARVGAQLRLDGSRVEEMNTRRVGRLVTAILRRLGTGETRIGVHLPQYDEALLGTAVLPSLSLDLVDGHKNELDFVATLMPGDAEAIRKLANDWLKGQLDRLQLSATAALHLRAGFLPLGTHDVVELFMVEGQSLYRSFASLYYGEKTIE